MSTIEITRKSEYFIVAGGGGADSGRQTARRILAIAMVLDGHSRRLAAQAGGMERQTSRDWVHRSNADGLRG